MGHRDTVEGAGLAFLRSISMHEQACIEYPFGRFSTGYGCVRHEARSRPAHVVAYEMHVGRVPAGMEVCHSCGNRPCVNPPAPPCRHSPGQHGRHRRPRNPTPGANATVGPRLTPEQVRYLRSQVDGGRRQKDLAVELGVALQTVNHVITRRTWASLADEIEMVRD